MIKIITDSTTGFPSDVLTEYNIGVLPMKLVLDGKEQLETSVIDQRFYGVMEQLREAPVTIPPSVDEIAAVFEDEIKQGNRVVAILMSGKLNKIYENAGRAKIKLKSVYPKADITIIDSQSTCMQEGLAVYYAAKMAKAGAPIDEIIKKAKASINHTRLFLVPKSFKYFDICGLLKKYQVAVSNILQIFPVLFVQDGKMIVQNIIQSKNKAISKMVDLFKSDSDMSEINDVIVSHIEDFDRAQKLAEQIRKITDAEVSITEIGAVVGSSLGPGTLGIAYSAEKELPRIIPKYETTI